MAASLFAAAKAWLHPDLQDCARTTLRFVLRRLLKACCDCEALRRKSEKLCWFLPVGLGGWVLERFYVAIRSAVLEMEKQRGATQSQGFSAIVDQKRNTRPAFCEKAYLKDQRTAHTTFCVISQKLMTVCAARHCERGEVRNFAWAKRCRAFLPLLNELSATYTSSVPSPPPRETEESQPTGETACDAEASRARLMPTRSA